MTSELIERLRKMSGWLASRKQHAALKTVNDAIAEVVTLEEKARALDWLLGQLSYWHYLTVNSQNEVYTVHDYGNPQVIRGVGPTPLAAVLDAMQREGK